MASCSDLDLAGPKALNSIDSCVGQPLENIIQRMVHGTAATGDFAAPSSSASPSYARTYDQTYPAPAAGGRFRAEFAIAWPPTIPVGSMPEAVELRAEVAVDVATAGTEQHPAYTPAAAAAASAAAAACCCGKLLVVQEDVVVQEEGFKVEAGRGRVRWVARSPGWGRKLLQGGHGHRQPTVACSQVPNGSSSSALCDTLLRLQLACNAEHGVALGFN